MPAIDFLKKVSAQEYGDDGANTVERIKALRETIKSGAYELETGDKLPEGV